MRKSSMNETIDIIPLFIIFKKTLSYVVVNSIKLIVFILSVPSRSTYYLIKFFISILLFSQSNYNTRYERHKVSLAYNLSAVSLESSN